MPSLRDLGLSEYEARAYRTLLRTGETTAKELSAASEVPLGRIYDVLSDLRRRDLVSAKATSDPKRYAAVDPETALDRLLTERRRDLRERGEEYERIAEELRQELGRETTAIEEGFWTAAVGPSEVVGLLVDRIRAADHRVVLVGGNPSPQFDVSEVGQRLTDELTAALDRGAAVSVLIAPDIVRSLPAELRRRYTDRLIDHPEFEARVAEGINGTFLLLDYREVCVEVLNPLDPEEPFAVIDLVDREFTADLRETFEPRWASADPLEL